MVVISGFLEAHNKEVKLIENGEDNREENFSLKLKIIVAKGLQLKESVIPTVNYGDETDDSGTSASENSDDETENIQIHMATQRIITQITENSEDTESSLSQAKQLLQLLNDQAFNIVSDGHQQVAYLVNHRTMTCSCRFFIVTGQPCKHLYAAFAVMNNFGDGKLKVKLKFITMTLAYTSHCM